MNRIRNISAAFAAALAIGGASSASAATIGNYIIATGGEVTATFLGQTAGYIDKLYLTVGDTETYVFQNRGTAVGTSVVLGSFEAGTELKFFINVSKSGLDYYSGPGSLNPDGIAHAEVINDYAPGLTYVGFEDIYRGGDKDYDDITFSLAGAIGVSELPAVPLPASAALLLGGVGALALKRRRK